MKPFLLAIFLMCALTIMACTQAPSATAPVVLVPLIQHTDWGTTHQDWNKFTLEAIDVHAPQLKRIAPNDFKKYCGKDFAKLSEDERAAFYLSLISALARFESSFKPDVTYTESFTDAKGKKVISRGLLQISQESANGYGCGITDAKMLHDPRTNLSCGVRILARWVEKDGVIQGGGTGAWKGAARYWSPFRKAERYEKIQAFTKQAGFCK